MDVGRFGCLTAGVVLGVDRLQSCLRYVRVNLGGRQAAMTEQHLHGAQIRPMIYQVCRESVAQRVRRKNSFYTSLKQMFF